MSHFKYSGLSTTRVTPAGTLIAPLPASPLWLSEESSKWIWIPFVIVRFLAPTEFPPPEVWTQEYLPPVSSTGVPSFTIDNFKFTYNGKAYEETKVVTLTAGHTVEYVYGKETPVENGTKFETDNSWTATTAGVTHHRAKCSVCGLYLDNDYVKDRETTGYGSDSGFVALCECGVKETISGHDAKNLREALLAAEKNGIPVVHLTAPYWQEDSVPTKGIHVHLETGSDNTKGDAGNGAIKVPGVRHPLPPFVRTVSWVVVAPVPNVKVFPAKSRLTSTLLDVAAPITKALVKSTSSVKVTFTFVSGYLFATLTASWVCYQNLYKEKHWKNLTILI